MTARRLLWLGLVLVAGIAHTVPVRAQVGSAVGGVAAQPRPGMPQPRDPRLQRQQTGTASMSGRVLAADTGTPLRRVQVRVGGQDLRGIRGAMTDAEGHYTVANLPPGRYSISFMKAGFANMSYGQKRPNQPGKMVDLAEGQKLANLDAALVRGGVIAGRILDDFGEPIVDARVQVLQLRWVNGRRRPVGGGRGSQTNDRGEFRVWGLASGDYYVTASSMDRQMFFDSQMGAPDAPESSALAATYYPGTASIDEAQKVTVAAGQEVGGVDFALLTTRVVRVSGIALNSEGRPMTNAFVMVMSRGMDFGSGMVSQGARTDPDGSFVIPSVAPGEYVLQARAERGSGRGIDNGEVATATVTVGAEDVKNVMLVVPKGVRVSGRVVFEGGTPATEVRDRLRVFMPPMDTDRTMFFSAMGGDTPTVTPELTFELRGVFGRRSFGVSAGPPWIIKAVRIGGADVLDTGYEFGKEDVSNVEIVLTNRAPMITGAVTGDNGQPIAEYVVLAYSTDEELWQQTIGVSSRGYGIGRPDQNGTYKITGLRPGSYYVVAVPEMPDEFGNPDLFRSLKDRAKQVRLQEGETERLDLVLQATGS